MFNNKNKTSIILFSFSFLWRFDLFYFIKDRIPLGGTFGFKAERTAAGMDDSSTPTPTKSNKVGSVNGDDERLAELYKGLDE